MGGRRFVSYSGLLILLSALLAAAVIVSAALGRYPIGVREILGILASRAVHVEPFWTATQESLLLSGRLPRIALACLVGCGLSVSGAAYQGVFRNPMAAPDLLGASSGAAFGAALGILMGFGGFGVAASAFAVSLGAVLLAMVIGNRAKGGRAVGLILAGIMIGSLASSGTSFVKLVADPENQLPAITYWLMGSLNGATGRDVLFALIPTALGLAVLMPLRWRMNLLTLGDDEARTMGVHAGQLRAAVILAATLMTAADVAVSGLIGWVGLAVPHLARRLTGSDYRRLLPASTLIGALFLLAADDLSRTLFAAEIPIGILTSVIGAPFFIYLILREEGRP